MSTKIYDGFALPTMRVGELLVVTNQLREDAHVIAHRMFIQDVVTRASNIYDTIIHHTNRETLPDVLGSIVGHIGKTQIYDMSDTEIRAAMEKSIKRRSPLSLAMESVEATVRGSNKSGEHCHYDYGFQIVVMQGSRKLVGIPYWQRREYEPVLKALPGYYEYGYWNNVDPPEDIPYSKWKRRGVEWDKALSGCTTRKDIPAMQGATFDIVNGEHVASNYEGIFTWIMGNMEDHEPYRVKHAQHLAILNEHASTLTEIRRKRVLRKIVRQQLQNPEHPIAKHVAGPLAEFKEHEAEMALQIAAGSYCGMMRLGDVDSAFTYVFEDRTKTHEYMNMKFEQAGMTARISAEDFATYIQLGDDIEKSLSETFKEVLTLEDLKTPIRQLLNESE